MSIPRTQRLAFQDRFVRAHVAAIETIERLEAEIVALKQARNGGESNND